MKNSDKDNQDIKKNNNKTDEKNVARHAEQKIQDKVKQLDKEAAKLKTKEFRYDNKDSSVVNEDLVAGRVSPHVLAANAAADENVIADDVTKVTETVEDQAIENVQTNVEVNIEPINEESAVAGQANIEQQVLLTRIGKGGAVSQEVVPTFPDGSLVTNGQPTSQTGILTGGTGTLAVHNITFNSPNVGTNVTGPGSSEHVNSSGTPLVSTTEPLEFAPSSQNTNVKENASVDTVSGDLNVTGTLAISASFSTENSQGQYGSLVIDPKTGEWNYHLDNTLVTTDALSEGEHHTEQFVITATDENNNIVKTVIHVEVEGTNDLPVISGLNHAAINEFGVVNQVSGALIATDPDHNETLVWHVDNSHGQFGELSIDEKTGQWQYNIDNKSTTTQQLASKQQVTEHFIVTATDSSGKPVSQQIDVLVTGSNELPIINGVHSAELTENVGNTVAAGQLTATDPDNGEHLVWQVEHGASQYGHFNIDANTGIWQFEIDNTSPVTQSLAQGQSVTEHFLVKVTDSSGTPVMQEIAIKINGTEQHAQINGTSNQTLTEDKALYQGLLRTDGQLTVTDPDAGENQFTAGSLQGQFGTLSINNNGHWTYTADNSQASIQGLNTGESLQETLVVHSVDGTEQKVTVTINGTDDKAVIAGTAQALITEDKDVRQGQLHADGQLTVTDLDAGENQFTAGTLQGQFGTLAINNNGHWTYTADNSQASIQGLNTGESLQETLVVHSVDGTEQKVTVTINGTDDKAVIAGTAQALITEDKDVRQGQLHADGQLTVTDLDAGENQFTAGTLQGQFGTLAINNNGHWTYTADNSQASIQGLNTGESLQETLIVHSIDGTEQKITVTINGTDDKAVIAGTAQALITEDKDVRQGQLHADGQLTVTDLDAGENQFSAGSLQGQFGTLAINNNGHWTYTADNSQASIQGLNTGESLTETLIVHSVDGTEQKVTVTINGTDDKAVIAGTAQALITEDKDVRQGQLHADGQLTVTDLDAGENQFTAGTLQGQFGTLAINNNGHWTYTADNSQASIQGLTTGESLTDTVLVHSVDGSEQKVTVTINGTDDKAVIAGTAQALITEDKDVRQGQLHADGQLTVTDLDAGENQFQASSLQGQLGTLSINSLGHWTYTADNSQASIQGLKTGESLTDTVLVHSVDGTEQKVTVTINGTDDKAVIAGTAQALITEDKDVRQGQLHADGQLTVTDLDTGENQFTAGSLQGQFGTLSINNQGHWTYTADNSQPTIQGLKTGEAVIDTVLVHSVDGTSQQISVTINGTDDKAQIAGTSTASLTEDKGVHAGQLRIDGALTVTDNDNGQAQFQATSLQGQFGTLSINNLGHWTYTTDNSQPTIQGLKTNESVTDTVLVHSVDGTSQQVTVTINGTDDKAVIAGTSTASITEDKDVHAGLLRVDGSLTVTDVDNGQAQFQGESLQGKFGTLSINNLGHWTYTADNSQPTIQGLKTGESITDTVLVHSVDGTSQQVAVTINGTDDKAVISGVDTGSVTENNAGKDMSPDQAHAGMSHLTGAMLYADGKLNISDPDAGDNEFDTNQGGGHGYGYTYHGSYGQLILNADGGWHYNVNAGSQHNGAMPGSVGTAIDKLGVGESLTDTITVRAKDGTTHDISITIHGSNDRPYCSSEVTLASGTEDTDQTFTLAQLLANSVDVDKNDAGQMSIDNLLVDHGSILDNKDGTFTLTQEKNYNGQVHLSYNVTDKHGGTTHTGASTTLSAVNDAAIVSGDVTGDVFEDHNIYSQNKIEVTGHLLVTDPDVGQQGFQYTRSSSVSDPFGGSLHISASGTWTYDVDNAKLQHLGANQEVLVTHRVYTTDGTAQDIIIKVTGTNDAPVVSSEVVLQTGTEDTDIIITQAQLLANSSDIDSNDLNQLHIDSVSSNHGVVTKNADGSFIFHPDQDYNGQVHFTYDVKDGHSGVTHTGATTSLTAIQDNAVITGQDSGDVKEDVNVGPVVAGNANMIETHGQMHISDPDAGENHFHVKNYAFIHDAGHPELHPIVSALGGYLSIGSDGTWFYRIDTRKSVIQNLGEGESTTDTVTITSIDGTSHVVTVTIHGTNDAPFCSSEVQLSSGTEDTVINLTSAQLLANASDIDANDLGQLSVANLTADHGSIVDNKDGTFSFNPAKDYNGDVHFSYDVKDIHGGVTHTGATTTLSAVNDNPDAQPVIDSITEDTDTHHAVNLLSGATDVDGDSLSISQVQVSFEGKTGPLPKGVSFASDGHTLVIDSHNPTFQHLSAGQNSDIVVHYMVDDNHGGQTAAVATITMVGTDDKATLASNIIQMTETQALDSQHNVYRGNLQLIDPDSGDNTQFLHSGKYVGQGYSPGYFDVFPDGSYQFSLQGANNRYADDRIASLRTGESTQIPYEVETSDGQKLTIMVKVIGEDNQARIEVAPYSSLTNHAYEDRTSASTPNEIWSSGNLHVIDPDHDQAGFVAQRISTPEGGEFYINPRGNWAYTIDNSKVQHLGAGESYQKTFTVESIDGSAHQDITVTVHGTNDNPIIASAVMLNNGVEDTQITLTSAQLLANATDIDDNDVKQLSIANLHADHGSIVVNLDGTYTFTPEKNFNGQVNFSYDVKDGHSGVTHTTATTTLAAVRDAAIITEVTTGSVTEDGSNRTSNNGVITELASGQLNVVDPDSGENHFDFSQFAETAIHDPFGGNLHIDRAGNWGYTVDNANLQHLSQGQTEVVIYQVHSQDGTPYELHINVLGTNDVPTVSLVTLSHGTEDVNYQMQASQFGFTDVDSTDTLHSINLTDLPDAQTQGAFLLDGHTVITGQSIAEADLSKLQFVPVKDFNGDVDFKYTVNDGHSDSLEATNTLHIDPVQDVASIDGQITSSVSVDVTEDSIINSINGHMILIDLDAGEDKFVANSHIQGTYGHLAIDADGNWQYNLDNNLPNTQSLSKGQVVTDSITITSPDGTASQTLNIAVHGHDDLLNLSVNEGDTLQSLDLYGGLKSGIINNVQFSTDGVHYSHQVPDGFVLASDGHTLQVDASHGSYNHLANGIASNIQIKFELQQGSGTNAVSTPQQALVVITGTSDSPIIHSFNPHAEQDTGPINGNLLQGASDVDDGANLILHDVQFQDPTTHNYVTVQAGQTHHILGVGSIAIASSGDYTFTPDSHFSGDVPRFIYRVTDTHGDYKDESQNTLNIKIDAYTTTIKPSVDIDAKSNSGISDHDNITNIHTPLVTGIVEAGARVVITDEKGQTVGSETATSAGAYSITTSTLSEGAHTLTVTATDAAGNTASTSQALVIDNSLNATDDVNTAVEDQGPTATQGNVLTNDDHDGTSITAGDVSGTYGTFHFSADGSYTYELDNSSVQSFVQGEKHDDNAIYTITDSAGNTTSAGLTVNITGTNDLPVISGSSTGAVIEKGSSNAGTAEVTGTLIATDPDTGDTLTWAVPSGAGVYGDLTLDQHGHWHYSLDNTAGGAADNLAAGQHAQESFWATATDSSGVAVTHKIYVGVTGSNDLPVISGSSTGAVIEKGSSNAGTAEVTGTLTATDPDTGDTLTWAVTNSAGTYGNLSIDQQGQWHYQLDNSNQATNALSANQQEQETFIVTATDSSGNPVSQTLTVDVQGSNDAPPVPKLVTPPKITGGAGSQGLHTSLGIPPIVNPNLAPTPLTGWGISDGHGHSITSLHGQFGTLHVNPATGNLDYQYQQNSGIQKSGTGHSGGETDTFYLTLGGADNSMVEVHLHLYSRSIHGNSGHHIDQTTLQGLDITPLTGAPGASASDEPSPLSDSTTDGTDIQSFEFDASLIDDSSIAMVTEGRDDEILRPVDHYLQMVGASKQHAEHNIGQSPDDSHLAAMTTADTSANADPLLDDIQSDAFENPLDDDQHQIHHHDGNIFDHPDDTAHLDNLRQDDDDSLNQALIDMHSQL